MRPSAPEDASARMPASLRGRDGRALSISSFRKRFSQPTSRREAGHPYERRAALAEAHDVAEIGGVDAARRTRSIPWLPSVWRG